MIKLITGVMNSGKSKRLIKMIDEAEGNVLILKPSLDTRDGAQVKSRATKRTYPAILVDETNLQLLDLIFLGMEKYQTVFLDEVQFFSEEFIEALLLKCWLFDIKIVASGLMRDFKGLPFPSTTSLWKRTKLEDMIVLHGSCYFCNDWSVFDVLMDEDNNVLTEGDTVQIEGETENHYESLCHPCYYSVKND
jgi:thymidine kinase